MNTRVDALPSSADQKLQQEFNEWAAAGRGDEMEDHHSDITEQTLALMDIQTADRILDLGCGTGWASRRMARIASEGDVVGLDVANEMLRRGEEASSAFKNVRYVWGSAEKIPEADNAFNKVLSVESFYYYADQGKALDELHRVMAPGAKLFILINLYKDNHYSLLWQTELKVPVQALSEAEYKSLLEKHGFKNVEARRIPDRSPTPETYSGKWFKNADELRDFKRIGALLLIATKAQ
ncbi:MAG: SAM-dependent methyltransferase [Candidatus Angelobacter sp.]|jgi:ubiquinone/menaquinone biosynthesis C-methylase UbiE|nr:SAM-dependent methyltransferase [Candidatus Angelobacter sp.]HEV7675417.1 class I SAM-dependent methyltransferase [Candidatus Angelobacter sp.]